MSAQKNFIPYQFPTLGLLKKPYPEKIDVNTLKETALIIQQTLQNFGIKITIVDVIVGTRFIRYEIQPEQGVRIKDITCRENEIKIATAAKNIHIEAPISGKAAIGIDILNNQSTIVTIREIMESEDFQKFPSNLAFAVGKDIMGNVVVSDIAKMRHLLIAGTTCSGKTACIDSIIMSVLYKAKPADVKLILIDTKMVSMSVYNGIPHLMIPVITDATKACAALNWAATEMKDRYYKFADIGVRDLKGYNKAVEMGRKSSSGDLFAKLPQILVIIDDLYDLIISNQKEVKESIIRLTQSSSATGIHLIISTQRPSTDVVAGLIKSNIPSRIAFSTVSAIDSQVILDESGAEKLLGNGDMLFKPQGYRKAVRMQGAYVSESEISDVVYFLKNQTLGNSVHDDDVINKIRAMQSSPKQSTDCGKHDPYFKEAGIFVIKNNKASIGMLQRVFKIGFNRAARIVDQLEEAKVVSADEGTKPRRILMTMEEFENKFCEIRESKMKKSTKEFIIKEEMQKENDNIGEKVAQKEETNIAESKIEEEKRQKKKLKVCLNMVLILNLKTIQNQRIKILTTQKRMNIQMI